MINEEIEELRRIRKLTTEILSTFTESLFIVHNYMEEYNLPAPNRRRINNLLGRALLLLNELGHPTPSVQHLFRTPPDKTESEGEKILKGWIA